MLDFLQNNLLEYFPIFFVIIAGMFVKNNQKLEGFSCAFLGSIFLGVLGLQIGKPGIILFSLFLCFGYLKNIYGYNKFIKIQNEKNKK